MLFVPNRQSYVSYTNFNISLHWVIHTVK